MRYYWRSLLFVRIFSTQIKKLMPDGRNVIQAQVVYSLMPYFGNPSYSDNNASA
jgi:hypothetical protein